MDAQHIFPASPCPAYTDFPAIPLYRDQVLSFLNQALSPLLGEAEPLSTAMINNYVKLKVLSPPEHKKYSREQVISLYLIALCKQVLTMGEIRQLLAAEFPPEEMEAAYTRFCAAMTAELAGLEGGSPAQVQSGHTLCDAVVRAFVYRRYAAWLLENPGSV